MISITIILISGPFNEIFVIVMLHWLGYLVASSCLLLLYSCTDQRLDTTFSFKSFSGDPALSFFFVCTICSIIGIPPFFGFWTKLYILYFVGAFGPMWLNLCLWGLSVLALVFYFVILQSVFVSNTRTREIFITRCSRIKFNYLLGATCFMCFGFLFLDQIFIILMFIIL